jgi:hypothetical protein
LLNRFYIATTHTLLRHDAVIDKLIGGEVMAFFVQGVSGPNYRRRAVQAGMELLEAVGYGSGEGPWTDVGIPSMRASPTWAMSGVQSSTSLPSVIRSTQRRECNTKPRAASCWSRLEWPMT